MLLDAPQGLRFYASPEVALAQGTATPLLIPSCDRQAMKILGNALATHQAVMVTALALQLFPHHAGALDPAACVKHSLDSTLTADSSLLLQVNSGWIMCGKAQAAWLQAALALWEQIAGYLAQPEHCFCQVCIAGDQGDKCTRVTLMVSQHVTPEALMKFLSLEPTPIAHAEGDQPCRIDCATPPSILLLRTRQKHQALQPVFLAWAHGQCFVLCLRAPDLLHFSNLSRFRRSQPRAGELMLFVTMLWDKLFPPSMTCGDPFWFRAATARPRPRPHTSTLQPWQHVYRRCPVPMLVLVCPKKLLQNYTLPSPRTCLVH